MALAIWYFKPVHGEPSENSPTGWDRKSSCLLWEKGSSNTHKFDTLCCSTVQRFQHPLPLLLNTLSSLSLSRTNCLSIIYYISDAARPASEGVCNCSVVQQSPFFVRSIMAMDFNYNSEYLHIFTPNFPRVYITGWNCTWWKIFTLLNWLCAAPFAFRDMECVLWI